MEIADAVDNHIDHLGAIYMDDIIQSTGCTKEKIGRWLRQNGFRKPMGPTTRRWVKSN